MERSIVPPGFENTAHPVFRSFVPPMALPETCRDIAPSDTACDGTSERSADSTAAVCPVCLDVIGEPATIVLCRHQFCAKCLLTWYKVRVICPICKQPGSYFLRNSSDGSAETETKMWTVAAAGGPEVRPSRDFIAAAVSCHEGLLCRLPDKQEENTQDSGRSRQQKRHKIS